jgi:arylsulfatase A-like enzyme
VYDAALADLDASTGRLLGELEQRGLLEDTIVVITSDHGENLGDHHLFNHRFALWDSLVRIPLVIRGPGVPAGRISRPVSTIDLFATLSRLAGLPIPAGISAQDLLAPDGGVAVTRLAPPLRREIETVRSVHPDVPIEPWLRDGHAVVGAGARKLLSWSDGARQLFDLAADPGELTPIDDPPAAEALGAELHDWLGRFPAYDPAQRGPGDDPRHVRASQEELREQLGALGYATED